MISLMASKFGIEDATIRLVTAVAIIGSAIWGTYKITEIYVGVQTRMDVVNDRLDNTDTQYANILQALEKLVSVQDYKEDKVDSEKRIEFLRSEIDAIKSRTGDNQADRWRCSHTLRLCREMELLNEDFTCGEIDYCHTPDDLNGR